MNRILLFLVMLIFTLPAYAVRVNSIYQADVLVSSQNAPKEQVIQQGFEKVLIKVSGKTNVLDNPALKSQLKKAATLVQEYGYSTINSQTFFTVKFDSDGVNQMLRDTGVPIWGLNRPLITVWAENETPTQNPEVISNDSSDDIKMLLQEASHDRGIPVLFPMMDLSEINQVSVNDVKTFTIPNLVNAAKRYDGDAILVMRVFPETNGFSAQARLVLGSDSWDWKISGKNKSELMHGIMDNVADTLSTRYSTVVTNSVQTELMLKITGITQQSDLADVLQYIQRINSVGDVEPSQIAGSEVTLKISMRGTRQALVQAIALDKKLTPVSDGVTLVYQWNH
jgi:hypothetical protein